MLTLGLGPLCGGPILILEFPAILVFPAAAADARPIVDVLLARDAAVGCVKRVAPPPSGLYADLAGGGPSGDELGEGLDAVEPYSPGPGLGDAVIVASPNLLAPDMDSLAPPGTG